MDYSKWDKLAKSLGDEYEDQDDDAKKEWMSRYSDFLSFCMLNCDVL